MSIENYPARLTTGYYRVRETWEDAASQLGAYRLLANAMAKADENPGYYVFSDDGVAIYPEEESGIEDESGIEEETGEEEAEGGTGEATGGDESGGETDGGVGTEGETGGGDTTVSDPTDTEQGDASGEAEDDAEADSGGETGGGEAGGDNSDEEDTADGGSGEGDSSGDGSAEDASTGQPSDEEFPAATEYENDDNEDTIAYARLKTLMNIRMGNTLEAEILATSKKNTILEVLQFCSNGWLRVRFAQADVGFAYVSNEDGQYAYIGYGLYTVKRGDNLWMIAEEQLGDGTRYTEIKELNGLTSNATVVGMQLILPQR